MKHLMTLMALVVAVTSGAQGTTIHEYPWNPDSNNDNLIGVDDLLDFLPVFGDEFGNPPEPCTYDGSDFEDLMFGIYNQSIILDSIFIEYELEDVQQYYLVGCPEPVTDTIIFSNSSMMTSFTILEDEENWQCYGIDAYGYSNGFQFEWSVVEGWYKCVLYNTVLNDLGLTGDGFFGGLQSSFVHSTTAESPLPLPEDWYLNEDGIHFDNAWTPHHWAYYANYLHILPYWHYAE